MKSRALAVFKPLLFILINLAVAPVASAYYDPVVQRWINRDPLEDQGSFSQIGSPRFRVLLSTYRFVSNNPISLHDPLGLQTQNECLQAASDRFNACLFYARQDYNACLRRGICFCNVVCSLRFRSPPTGTPTSPVNACITACLWGYERACLLDKSNDDSSCNIDLDNARNYCYTLPK